MTQMRTIQLKDKTFETYLNARQLQERITELGAQIASDFAGEEVVVLGVLNGSFIFMADLVRAIPMTITCDFLKISSYAGTESTGKVTSVFGISQSLAGKNVVIVEDIVDTGASMAYLKEYLATLGPKRVAIATLLFKREAFTFNYPLDYVGFEIPNKFVVGFGLDYDGEGRNYQDIYQLSIP
jgi:hypoxanthine phosphoribosyltransferase